MPFLNLCLHCYKNIHTKLGRYFIPHCVYKGLKCIILLTVPHPSPLNFDRHNPKQSMRYFTLYCTWISNIDTPIHIFQSKTYTHYAYSGYIFPLLSTEHKLELRRKRALNDVLDIHAKNVKQSRV